MAQDYDKLIKQNIEEIILPLAEKLLNISPKQLEEIPDDLQVTLERRPDFLKKVLHQDSRQDYILHIEFQVEDSEEMLYRMVEYFAILLRKYRLPIKQYVFFIGNREIRKMFSDLQLENFSFAYKIINLQTYSYKLFLNSDIPEEIILAILADFEDKKAEEVTIEILQQIKALSLETFRKEKCVVHLELLANLRNLQEVVQNLLEKMALVYNLENDLRFKQGLEKGLQKGLFNGVKNMLMQGFSMEQIASLLEVSMDFIKEVAQKIQEEKDTKK
ncbi:hypothetical protein [Raineya sp.]|jgi:hypothetical protein